MGRSRNPSQRLAAAEIPPKKRELKVLNEASLTMSSNEKGELDNESLSQSKQDHLDKAKELTSDHSCELLQEETEKPEIIRNLIHEDLPTYVLKSNIKVTLLPSCAVYTDADAAAYPCMTFPMQQIRKQVVNGIVSEMSIAEFSKHCAQMRFPDFISNLIKQSKALSVASDALVLLSFGQGYSILVYLNDPFRLRRADESLIAEKNDVDGHKKSSIGDTCRRFSIRYEMAIDCSASTGRIRTGAVQASDKLLDHISYAIERQHAHQLESNCLQGTSSVTQTYVRCHLTPSETLEESDLLSENPFIFQRLTCYEVDTVASGPSQCDVVNCRITDVPGSERAKLVVKVISGEYNELSGKSAISDTQERTESVESTGDKNGKNIASKAKAKPRKPSASKRSEQAQEIVSQKNASKGGNDGGSTSLVALGPDRGEISSPPKKRSRVGKEKTSNLSARDVAIGNLFSYIDQSLTDDAGVRAEEVNEEQTDAKPAAKPSSKALKNGQQNKNKEKITGNGSKLSPDHEEINAVTKSKSGKAMSTKPPVTGKAAKSKALKSVQQQEANAQIEDKKTYSPDRVEDEPAEDNRSKKKPPPDTAANQDKKIAAKSKAGKSRVNSRANGTNDKSKEDDVDDEPAEDNRSKKKPPPDTAANQDKKIAAKSKAGKSRVNSRASGTNDESKEDDVDGQRQHSEQNDATQTLDPQRGNESNLNAPQSKTKKRKADNSIVSSKKKPSESAIVASETSNIEVTDLALALDAMRKNQGVDSEKPFIEADAIVLQGCCYYYPYCYKNPKECNGVKKGACTEVKSGNVSIPISDARFLDVKVVAQRIQKNARRRRVKLLKNQEKLKEQLE